MEYTYKRLYNLGYLLDKEIKNGLGETLMAYAKAWEQEVKDLDSRIDSLCDELAGEDI
jgi:hypothetical protein